MATISWRRSVTALAILTALTAPGGPGCADEGKAEQRIEEALAQTITPKEFVDTPLREVIGQFAAELKIPIQFDLKAMADGTATPNTPITINLDNISLESALALILEPLDLTVVIKHEVLLVTTETEAEGILSIKVYPVADLVTVPGTASTLPDRDYESLIEVIMTSVGSSSWEEVGGPGSIQENDFARALVVSQTRAVHREIRDLLADLRRAALLAAGRPAPPEENTAERRIEEALAQTIVPKDFVNAPLREAMSQFAVELKVPIHFDKKAMADGTATADTPVSIRMADVSAESALALILEPLDLTVVIKHEVLLVTTTTEAEGIESAEVYPVDDLLTAGVSADYEELIEVITTSVAPTAWSESGPNVTVDKGARAIVVLQTRAIHRDIRDLLAQLRAAAVSRAVEAIAVAAEPVADDGEPYVRVYRINIPRIGFWGGFSVNGGMGGGTMGGGRMGGGGMGGAFSVRQMSGTSTQADPSNADQPSSDDIVKQQAVIDKRASELAAAIPEFIEPETWESAGGTGRIQAAAGALIVRQTRDVHLKVMEFLSSF